MVSEQRRHPRVRRRTTAVVRPRRWLWLTGPSDAADTVDVSRGGVRIRTQAALAAMQRVVLGIRSRFLRRMVRFEGRVVWVRRAGRAGAEHTLAGIRFLRMGAEGSMMLHRMVTGQGAA